MTVAPDGKGIVADWLSVNEPGNDGSLPSAPIAIKL